MDPFLRSIGFRKDSIRFVPISGLAGVNLIERPNILELAQWYNGPCLIETLDTLRLPQRGVNMPLRVSVYDYYKSSMGVVIGDCISAKVESGALKERDELLLMPHNILVSIKAIQLQKKKVSAVLPGSSVELSLHLPSSFDPSTIKSGDVLCDPKYPIN